MPTRGKARFVTVVGQDELSNGEVKIKNMTDGEQQAVARGTRRRTSTTGQRHRTIAPSPIVHRTRAMNVQPLGTLARTHTCGELTCR